MVAHLDPDLSGEVSLCEFAAFVAARGGMVQALRECSAGSSALFSWGSNRMGECGFPPMVASETSSPKEVEVLRGRPLRQLACDGGVSACVLESGEVYTWGRCGLLLVVLCTGGGGAGAGDGGGAGSAGGAGAAADPLCCSNSHAKLGHGASSSAGDRATLSAADAFCSAPRKLEALSGQRIVQLSVASTWMAAVSESGALYTWGGYSAHARHAPTLGHVKAEVELEHGDGGTLFLPRPTRVQSFQHAKVSAVCCSTEHALAITSDGQLHSWGGGERGKLGLGSVEDSPTPRLVVALKAEAVVAVACGAFHSMAVTRTGKLYVWGSGKDGKLGLGEAGYTRAFQQDGAGQVGSMLLLLLLLLFLVLLPELLPVLQPFLILLLVPTALRAGARVRGSANRRARRGLRGGREPFSGADRGGRGLHVRRREERRAGARRQLGGGESDFP